MRTLAERLSWARAQAGLSQRGLAKAAGIKSPRHIGFLESGQNDNPGLKTLRSLGKALGVTFGWLANGEGPLPDAPRIKRIAQLAYSRAEDRASKGAA